MPATTTNTSDPLEMKARINRGDRSNFTYPADLDQQPVFFSINMRPYQIAAGLGGTIAKGAQTVTGQAFTAGKYFHLPIPVSGLDDAFHMDYASKEMGMVGGIGASISQIVDNPIQGTLSAIGGGIAGLAQGIGEAAAGALGDVLPGVGGDKGVAAGQLAAGTISNPNLALLFKGVQLRKHTFSWRMIAYDEQESTQIDNMITELKRSALPARVLNGNFVLDYPDVAFLYLVGPKGNGMITFSEKGAFIEDIKVSYNGQSGRPAFFKKSNSPVEVNLQITFQERGIIASQDIGG